MVDELFSKLKVVLGGPWGACKDREPDWPS
jgi:hypothetical protein